MDFFINFPKSSLPNLLTHTDWEIFLEQSSTDFFTNFRDLLCATFLTHTDWEKRLRTKDLRHRRAVLHERPLLTILSKLACPADSYPQTLVEVWAFFLLAGTAWKTATTARSLFLSRLDL